MPYSARENNVSLAGKIIPSLRFKFVLRREMRRREMRTTRPQTPHLPATQLMQLLRLRTMRPIQHPLLSLIPTQCPMRKEGSMRKTANLATLTTRPPAPLFPAYLL